VLHGRMFGESALEQKRDLGAVGINLIYGAFHHLDAPTKFFGGLREGIRDGNISIDACYIEGVELTSLGKTEIARHLTENHLADKIAFDENGEFRIVQETTPRTRDSRIPLEMVEEFSDITAWKSRRLNSFANLKGIIAEVGEGNRIAGRVFEALNGRTIYEAVAFPTIEASRDRYGDVAGHHPTIERLRLQLESEYPRVTYHRPHRKFVVTHVVETRIDSIEGWIGFKGQFKIDGEPHMVAFHFVIRGEDAAKRRESLGALGINLLYAVHYYRSDAKQFRASLSDGLDADSLSLDQLEATGELVAIK